MAKRQARLITKNSAIVNRPLPSSLLPGEAIVNTAEGIVLYSGVTTSTNEWTPAGTGTTATFFEVGSNLYDLRLRNKITAYEGQTGNSLVGKFLSGTTNGFVLANISDIADSTDSYITGATWNPNQLTLNLNQGKPSVSVNISAFSALTITNDLFVNGEVITNDLTVTGTGIYDNVANGSNNNEIVNWSSLTAHTSTTDRYVTGGTYDNNTALITFSGANNFPIFTVDLSSIDVNDTFVTGGTISYDLAGLDATITLTRNDGTNITITGLTDIHTTGATLVGNTVYFNTNDALSAYTLDLSALDTNDTFVTGYTYNPISNTLSILQNEGEAPLSVTITSMSGLTINGDFNVTGNTNLGPTTATTIDAGTIYSGGTDLITIIDGRDTYVTGFTYNPNNNTFTITRNQGEPALATQFTSVTGLTVSTLGTNKVVYTTGSGVLTTESGFEYNETTNLLTVGNINVQNPTGSTAMIGQGGLVIGSGGSPSTSGIGDLVVHGDLTVFGDTTTISTSELYVEDPQIELNYNPTGNTTATSVGSGVLIQDGSGVAGQDVKIGIGVLFGSSISGDTTEYTSTTGFSNRGWVTQLNDIVIRNSSPVNFGDPDGVRVLAENDILDGGGY
jgi:hypothetical protein